MIRRKKNILVSLVGSQPLISGKLQLVCEWAALMITKVTPLRVTPAADGYEEPSLQFTHYFFLFITADFTSRIHSDWPWPGRLTAVNVMQLHEFRSFNNEIIGQLVVPHHTPVIKLWLLKAQYTVPAWKKHIFLHCHHAQALFVFALLLMAFRHL